VTGRICEIGHNDLESSFETGKSSSHLLLPHFYPIAFLEEDFEIKEIILLWINYIIFKYGSNEVINNNCGTYQDLSLLLKFPLIKRNNKHLVTRPRKYSPALVQWDHPARFRENSVE